jgi:AcrR family transcriptional regulator
MATGETRRPTDGRSLRWVQHRAERRAAFVAAGVQAMDQFGPDAHAEQIAEAAGVSRTVLYRYFRDREDLREAIAEHIINSVVQSVLPHLVLTPTATPKQVITSTTGEIISWFDEHPNLYFFLRSRRNGPGLANVEATLADRIAALLKMFLVLFGLNIQLAEPAAFGIVGLVESSCEWWLSKREISRDEFTRFVASGIWYILDGHARENGIVVGYDDPLPLGPPELTGLTPGGKS